MNHSCRYFSKLDEPLSIVRYQIFPAKRTAKAYVAGLTEYALYSVHRQSLINKGEEISFVSLLTQSVESDQIFTNSLRSVTSKTIKLSRLNRQEIGS